MSRLKSEFILRKISRTCDLVLCFGNLPPLFKLSCPVFVYVQNRLIVDDYNFCNFNHSARLRLTIEKMWLSKLKKNANIFIVQSLSMCNLLKNKLNIKSENVLISPFIHKSFFKDKEIFHNQNYSLTKKYDFVYVASGEPHKNHVMLIDAWCLLAKENLYPSLCLTLHNNDYNILKSNISKKKLSQNLSIINLGHLDKNDVKALYLDSSALIYPSLLESYGLPLIEASSFGLPILASELDYVRDSVNPVQTFDPNSAHSISRAVKRFLGIPERKIRVLDGSSFISKLYTN